MHEHYFLGRKITFAFLHLKNELLHHYKCSRSLSLAQAVGVSSWSSVPWYSLTLRLKDKDNIQSWTQTHWNPWFNRSCFCCSAEYNSYSESSYKLSCVLYHHIVLPLSFTCCSRVSWCSSDLWRCCFWGHKVNIYVTCQRHRTQTEQHPCYLPLIWKTVMLHHTFTIPRQTSWILTCEEKYHLRTWTSWQQQTA